MEDQRMKRDTQFEKELSKIFDLTQTIQAAHLIQLRTSVETLCAANRSEVDTEERTMRVFDVNVRDLLKGENEITPFHDNKPITEYKNYRSPEERMKQAEAEMKATARPTINLKDEMICTAEPETIDGDVGNLRNLSYVNNEFEKQYGRDFYHHCPYAHHKLVRLVRSKVDRERICPQCGTNFHWK